MRAVPLSSFFCFTASPRRTSAFAQAAWYLKCRAITQKNYIDDLEVEEEVRNASE